MNQILLGSLIPMMGTSLGATAVLFPQRRKGAWLQSVFLGFAAGVMVAASVWSLLIPAIERCQGGAISPVIIPTLGYLAGIFFLLLMDHTIPHQHLNSEQPEGMRIEAKPSLMLIFSITLHNIPEGMAVGAVLAGLNSGAGITRSAAYALCMGIAIQNIPEGAVVALPVSGELGKGKAFLCGVLSGVVEPIAALLTVALANLVVPTLPFFLAFAAGAMFYVVVEELIPEAVSISEPRTDIATLSFAGGFLLMMVLDVLMG